MIKGRSKLVGILVVCLFLGSAVGCGSSETTRSRPRPSSSTTTPKKPTSELTAKPSGSGDVGSGKTAAAGASDEGADAASGDWGNLSGRFVYDGSAPTPSPIQVTKDVEFCGKHNLVDESLVVNSGGGLANVVVWLYEKPSKIHPSYDETASETVVLDNENCRFEPRVCVLRTTQTLRVTNSDPVGHNTKADLFTNASFNPIIPAKGSFETKLEQSERMPAPVSCSIHPWMSAWLLVRDDPYVAVSDKEGNFEIKNLPAGKVTLVAWQGKYINKVSVDGKATEWSKGRFEYDVRGGDNNLGVVKVPPSAFE
jgi:hypothetical protein